MIRSKTTKKSIDIRQHSFIDIDINIDIKSTLFVTDCE